VLYSDLSDAKVFDILAKKLGGLRGNGATCAKNNMSAKQWIDLFQKGDGHCQYSGEKFSDINDISFERIDPTRPYEKGNVLLIKTKYNNAKSNVDRLLHMESLSDEMVIRLLQEGIKVVRKRIKKKVSDLNKELASQAVNQNLRVAMFTNLKRGRFSDDRESNSQTD